MRVAALVLLAAGPVMPAWAAKSVLWIIGKPDESSREFSRAAKRVVYEIGKSSPGQDWGRTQSPGTEPFTIRFRLGQPPAGSYHLIADLLFRDARIPRYKVNVNGKSGSFCLHPEPKQTVSEADLNVVPYATAQRLRMDVPARQFREGLNEIRLTVEGGSLDYDAVALEQDTDTPGGAPRVRIEPSVLWQRKADALYEDANLIVDPGALGSGGRVSLRIGSETFDRDLPTGWEFGDVIMPISVRDPGGRTLPASVVIQTPRGQRTLELSFKPQRKWKLFVAPSTHLDIGYTAIQPKAVEVHLRNLEQAAVLAEKYPSFRWNTEGAWAVQQFLDRGGASAATQLQALVGGARLGVNAFDFNLQAYLCSLEELNVATDRSYSLHRRSGTPYQVATVTDVPSLPWWLPSILHRAGIRYLASGANQVRGPLLAYGALDRSSPFFWEGPDGGRVLVWYTKSYAQVRRLFDIPGSVERARSTLQTFLSAFPERYPYDAALVYGFDGDNAPIGDGDAAFFEQWNVQYAYPRIIPARYDDFFAYLEQQGTQNLPVFRGDGGAYWEDGAGECPIATAVNRGNQAGAVDAEKMAALAVLANPALSGAARQIGAVWEKILLFDEHTFGARAAVLRPDAPDTRLQWQMKEQFATEAAGQLRWKRLEWLDRLNQDVPHGNDAVVVWNLENWTRSGPVEIQLPSGRTVVDAGTGQAQPYDVISDADNTRVVRFMARDVPPLSYRLFTAAPAGNPPAVVPAPGTRVLENEFYKVTLDPARLGIASIWDKQLGRELVEAGGADALGEFIKVRETSSVRRLPERAGNNWYSGVRTRIDLNDFDLPAPVLSIEHATGSRVAEVRKSALAQEATLQGTLAGGQPVRLTVRLYVSLRRIDLAVKAPVEFAGDGHAQGAYVAFPFALRNPEFAYNLPIGWVNPAKDMLPGGATEWFVVDNAASISGDGASVTVAMPDTPLITLGDINRGRWPKAFVRPHEARLFSYVMNNYWLTNFPAGQETGVAVFRYSITSAREADRVAQRRFGEEQRHPLLADFRPGRSDRAGQAAIGPRVRVTGDTVNLVTMKPAQFTEGYVLRLAETGGRNAPALIQWNGARTIRKAFLCSLKEQVTRELAVHDGRIEITLSPYALETVLVQLQQ